MSAAAGSEESLPAGLGVCTRSRGAGFDCDGRPLLLADGDVSDSPGFEDEAVTSGAELSSGLSGVLTGAAALVSVEPTPSD